MEVLHPQIVAYLDRHGWPDAVYSDWLMREIIREHGKHAHISEIRYKVCISRLLSGLGYRRRTLRGAAYDRTTSPEVLHAIPA